MRVARHRVPLTIVAAIALSACGARPDSPKLGGPPGETPVQEAKAAASGRDGAEPPRESDARTVDGYKRDAARRIYSRSAAKLYDGVPPPLLKAVVVLSIEIDREGAVKQLKPIRSNGHRDLEQRAMESVRDASPLPVPRDGLLKRGHLAYYETWLFRDDDRFQIRSLAEAQAGAT